MIHLESRHAKIIADILEKYPYQFYAFGSRVKGTHRENSDLDLCYKEAIPYATLSHIQEDFTESDLPFNVDVVNWNDCDAGFQQLIEASMEKVIF